MLITFANVWVRRITGGSIWEKDASESGNFVFRNSEMLNILRRVMPHNQHSAIGPNGHVGVGANARTHDVWRPL
jgi:hypothetical protein